MKNQKSSTQQVVVIGAGLAGLASAALIAKQGWSVTVLEKNQTVGGRARLMELDGFRFDMGPSWYMMPEIFEQFFAEFGKKVSDYYTLIRLDPRYKVLYEGKKALTLTDNIEKNMQVFESVEVGAGQQLYRFLQKTRGVYEQVVSNIIYKDVWDPVEWLKIGNVTAFLNVMTKFPIWRSWQSETEKYFQSLQLKQILGFTSLFLGAPPAMTPSTFSILAWADFGAGVWYPKGGMTKVVDALKEVCQEQGVKILTQQEVTTIEVKDQRVVAVRTKHKRFPADVVIGAGDLQWLETQLLSEEHQTYPKEYWQSKQLGISALMIYLGLNKHFPKLVHHNVYFSDDWEENFAEIFETETLPKDPSLYISVRSATDRSIVPKNGEEIVVLVPLAANTKFSKSELDTLGQQIIKKVEQVLEVPLRKHIVTQRTFGPSDFAKDYHAYRGTALGLAHTALQSFWWRPKHQSSKVSGLYYAGQYTNPGVGVPTAIVSGHMVANKVGFASSLQESIFQRGSTTYYYSSVFFRGQVKHDVFTLYAYVRTIDDFVDQQIPDLKQLELYWDETVKAWSGAQSSYTVIDQFIKMAKRKKLEWSWVEAFWQAMRSELTKHEYRSYKELEKYMYGSAEVIGLMMAKILDLSSEAMKTAAVQGRAMQLLNFIRDVAEDRELKRKYLVYDDAAVGDPSKWKASINTYLQKYYQLQQEAEAGYKYLPKRYRIPIRTAANMYLKTARIIEKNPHIVWQKKVKPRKWQVLYELFLNILQ